MLGSARERHPTQETARSERGARAGDGPREEPADFGDDGRGRRRECADKSGDQAAGSPHQRRNLSRNGNRGRGRDAPSFESECTTTVRPAATTRRTAVTGRTGRGAGGAATGSAGWAGGTVPRTSAATRRAALTPVLTELPSSRREPPTDTTGRDVGSLGAAGTPVAGPQQVAVETRDAGLGMVRPGQRREKDYRDNRQSDRSANSYLPCETTQPNSLPTGTWMRPGLVSNKKVSLMNVNLQPLCGYRKPPTGTAVNPDPAPRLRQLGRFDYRRLIGARSATSLRSERSLLKRITTIPPGSMPVTTPSPKVGWTTSSPRR